MPNFFLTSRGKGCQEFSESNRQKVEGILHKFLSTSKGGKAMNDKEFFRRVVSLFISALVMGALLGFPAPGWAQKTQALSIATGGTGGIYYVMGGGIAALLTKNIPNLKVTAESTAASIENALLIEAGKVDLTLILGSTSYDALLGK
jgi:hypothetical protein